MYSASTNAPVKYRSFEGSSGQVCEWLQQLPHGWQFTVTYAGHSIAWGLTPDDLPTAHQLIDGAYRINGVE